MFEEPNEEPAERPIDPAQRAKEKSDEFRMHAELAAVFEGCRKFDAAVVPGLDAEIARDIQRSMGKLDKAKVADTPIIVPESAGEAARILNIPRSNKDSGTEVPHAGGLSTNDYHIHRRPGEVMIVRWLEGDQVATFYERLQAHFDAALKHYREEERQAREWKQDAQTLAYLEALDKIDVKMEERYLREPIRKHNVFVLSTQSADEMDILHLCDFLMGVDAAEVVGAASAPPDEPTESDRAWFFKLFSLRGMNEGVEKMCFFTYMQKTEEGW